MVNLQDIVAITVSASAQYLDLDTAIVIVGIILAFAQFILSILGVAWGNQLYNSKETWPEVFALPMAVVTTQQPHVQPTGVVIGQPAVAVEAVSVQDMQGKV